MNLDESNRHSWAIALAGCIERSTLLTDQIVKWGEIELRMRYFVGPIEPPLGLVTSVRAVLFAGARVMVMRSSDGTFHINPGGRREPGETTDETLRRELLEETGWAIQEPQPLGFIHFAHLSPQPDGYPYPYPEFVQFLFVAEAAEHVASPQLPAQYEVSSKFLSIGEAHKLLDADQATVLTTATRLRTG